MFLARTLLLWPCLLFLAYESTAQDTTVPNSRGKTKIIKEGQYMKVFLPTILHDTKSEAPVKRKHVTKSPNDLLNGDGKNDTAPVVMTVEGPVQGYITKKAFGKYYSFDGIPYADKPVRFQAPTPHPGWTEVFDATKAGSPCLQFNRIIKTFYGSEECLHLNVHTPSLTTGAKLPVFVWIFGGEFRYGVADTKTFGPSKILEQGVVFVAISYRLDALGFLSTGTKEAPGNAGMRDIVEALKWMRRNIEKFGGDKDNICIYGISSSSSMVDLLTVSPMAKGLFAKAITQSSIGPHHYIDPNPLAKVFNMSRAAGIESRDLGEIMERFKTMDGFALMKAAQAADDTSNILPYSFLPVVEKKIEGVEPFLDEWPLDALKSGRGSDVPLLAGVNNAEGTFVMRDVKDPMGFVNDNDDKWESFLIKYPDRTMEDNIQTAEALHKFYVGDNANDLQKLKGFIKMVGDTGILYTTRLWLDTRVNVSLKSTIYFMEFAVDSVLGKSVVRLDQIPEIKGAGHAENIPFVFETRINYDHLIDQATRLAMDRTLTLMGNFMKYGDPTPKKSKLLPVKWLPYDREANCMRLGKKMKMLKNPHKKSMDFIKSLNFDF